MRESIVGSWIWERRRLDCEIRNSSRGLQRSLSWNNSLSKVTLLLLSAGRLALLHMKGRRADRSSHASPSLSSGREGNTLSTYTHAGTYVQASTHARTRKQTHLHFVIWQTFPERLTVSTETQRHLARPGIEQQRQPSD